VVLVAPAVVLVAPAVVLEAPAVVLVAPAVVLVAPAVVLVAPAVVLEAPAVVLVVPAVVLEAPAVVLVVPAVVLVVPAAQAGQAQPDEPFASIRSHRASELFEGNGFEIVASMLFSALRSFESVRSTQALWRRSARSRCFTRREST
jgi:hypothetical protein